MQKSELEQSLYEDEDRFLTYEEEVAELAYLLDREILDDEDREDQLFERLHRKREKADEFNHVPAPVINTEPLGDLPIDVAMRAIHRDAGYLSGRSDRYWASRPRAQLPLFREVPVAEPVPTYSAGRMAEQPHTRFVNSALPGRGKIEGVRSEALPQRWWYGALDGNIYVERGKIPVNRGVDAQIESSRATDRNVDTLRKFKQAIVNKWPVFEVVSVQAETQSGVETRRVRTSVTLNQCQFPQLSNYVVMYVKTAEEFAQAERSKVMYILTHPIGQANVSRILSAVDALTRGSSRYYKLDYRVETAKQILCKLNQRTLFEALLSAYTIGVDPFSVMVDVPALPVLTPERYRSGQQGKVVVIPVGRGGTPGGYKWVPPPAPAPLPVVSSHSGLSNPFTMSNADIQMEMGYAFEDEEHEEEEEEAAPACLVCNRVQFLDKSVYQALEPGLYFVDMEYLFRLDVAPEGVEPAPLTQLDISKLTDVPTYELFFIVGSLVGGKKRDPFGGLKRGFMKEIGNPVRRAASNLGKELKHNLKSAALEAAITHLGAGSYAKKKKHKSKAKKRGMGAYVSTARGMGAYMEAGGHRFMAENELYQTQSTYTRRTIQGEANALEVTGEEVLLDVFNNSASAYNVSGININPASIIFRKMCQDAVNHTKYRIKGMEFIFIPNVNNTTASGGIGSVYMAVMHNVTQPLPATAIEIDDLQGSATNRADLWMRCGMECNELKGAGGYYYTLPGDVPAGEDPKTYHVGKLVFATLGINGAAIPVGTRLGKIKVRYVVELFENRLFSSLGKAVLFDDFYMPSGATVSNFFSNSPPNSVGAKNSLLGGSVKTNTYTFPDFFAGTVRVDVQYGGTGFTGVLSTPTVAGNVTIQSSEGQVVSPTCSAATATVGMQSFTLDVVGASTFSGNTFTLVVGSIGATTFGWVRMRVTQINPSTPETTADF